MKRGTFLATKPSIAVSPHRKSTSIELKPPSLQWDTAAP